MRRSEWLLLTALMLVFLPALAHMAEVWTRVDYYSHGFLVPLVAVWTALRERPRWPSDVGEPQGYGLWVLLGAFVAFLGGLSAGIVFIEGLAFVLALAGGVLYARGLPWLRCLAFPLCFLLFMVPLPTPWLTPVILQLQLFVSEVAIEVLHGLAVPVMRVGNVLELPGGETLFVAEACSGVTSLVTLIPLAVVLARATLRSLPEQGLLVLLVVPFAMLGNLLRVVVTVLMARHWGVAQVAAGPIHDSTGVGSYLLACLLLVATGAMLRRGRLALSQGA